MINLTFITVSNRNDSLKELIHSIEEQMGDLALVNIKLKIIFDFDPEKLNVVVQNFLDQRSSWIEYEYMPDKRNNPGGHYGKKILIEKIENGWIYQIDDDNILYPNFIKEFYKLVLDHPESNLFCFWQQGRYTPKSKEDIRVGVVDTAMYVFHKNITHNIEYPYVYGGDGMYLVNLLNNSDTKLWIEKKYLCYYNYTRDNPKQALCQVAKKYGTDKYHRHNYCKAYEKILANYQHKKDLHVLEIGVLGGASIKMWLEWFPGAKIYGIDNWSETHKHINVVGAKIFNANSKDISVCDILGRQTFDIIIDDGDHHPYAQLTTLWNLWPLLNNGGIYIIEDIQNIDTYKKHWGFIPSIEFIDMRQDGGTYDSILLIIHKGKHYNV